MFPAGVARYGDCPMEALARPPRPDRAAPTVAEAIIDLLVDLGVDTYFGIPGGPAISLFHRILLHPRARLIESRHETSAAFEAMGLWRATGRMAAVVVTAGPGVANAITGVAAAEAEGVPLLVLAGDVASDGRRFLQNLGADRGGGIERLVGGLSRAVRRVERPAGASGQVLDAVRAATGARPGPAVVVVPVDRADLRTQPPRLRPAPSGDARPGVDPQSIDWIADALAEARRPLIVLGHGCRAHAAAARRLVDAAGVPFMTTPQAKGLVSEHHPLSLRTSGMSASFWARRYCAGGPDVTLVLGTDLDDVSTAGTPVVAEGGTLVHVDTDPTVLGRNVETTLALAIDVGVVCRALCERVTTRADLAPLRAAKAESPFDEPGFADDASPSLAPHRVIADLERAAAPEDRFVTDIGEHMLFALHYLTATNLQRFTIHLGLGSMGSGIGSAIGLALGDPTRRVICICGDGGMQMNGTEVLVALRHRLPVVYAVFNDARYNMVFHGYRLTHGREASWSTEPIDFALWARALGVPAARIERPGQITRARLDELTATGPAVLDIRQDRDVRIRGDGRIEALRQMSFGEES